MQHKDLLVLAEPGPQNGVLFLLSFWSCCQRQYSVCPCEWISVQCYKQCHQCRPKHAGSPAKKHCFPPAHNHAVPELLPGHDSPDVAHSRNRHCSPSTPQSCHSSPTLYTASKSSNDALLDKPSLQQELSFSPSKQQPTVATAAPAAVATHFSSNRQRPAAAACCLRCGVTAGAGSAECRFHPALLSDPGPLLFCPEWHACRAAKHTDNEPGCYKRHGHYYPMHAVTDTGLVESNREQRAVAEVGDCMPQPRTCHPVPRPASQH